VEQRATEGREGQVYLAKTFIKFFGALEHVLLILVSLKHHLRVE
jgi:hypothetical protein